MDDYVPLYCKYGAQLDKSIISNDAPLKRAHFCFQSVKWINMFFCPSGTYNIRTADGHSLMALQTAIVFH